MLNEIIFVFWFFAPAGIANVAAFFSGKLPYFKKFSYPVDFYAKFRGKRVLGDHKTIRGFVFGIIAAIIAVYLQIYLYNNLSFINSLTPINYNSVNPFALGFLSGFGALFGDSVKSFFKRQIGVLPGKSWLPFDQIDYILGGILFTSFYIQLTSDQYIALFLVWFLLHPLTTLLGYILRLKESPL